MAYNGYVTFAENVRKAENSDNLYLCECYGETVVIGSDIKEGDLVLYLPTDGKLERWFGDKLHLFRKNEDGTPQGGYMEDNGHIRAIKLRGNQSYGIVISIARISEVFGAPDNWKAGDAVNTLHGEQFCEKYIPKRRHVPQEGGKGKKSWKGRRADGIKFPDFAMHADTEQFAYNTHRFKEGDIVQMTLKMHGTSGRSAYTEAVLPNNWFRRLFHLKPKKELRYVCGTRRTVVTNGDGGFYGDDTFRLDVHEKIKPALAEGMEVFYEIVGWVNKNTPIMPPGDAKKVSKEFAKEFGKTQLFTYGCDEGEHDFYVYRISYNNGETEATPEQIREWCEHNGFHYVPEVETFTWTTVEDAKERISKYFEDLVDPVGKTHIKEGVVLRILNRPNWVAFKDKVFEFKVLSGVIAESADTSKYSDDMLAEI